MLKCLLPFCLLQLFLVIIHVTTACKYSCNKCSKRFFQWWRQPAPKHRLCRTVGHQNTFLRLEMSYLCMKWCVERWMTQCGSKTYTGGDTSCSLWLWWRFYNSYFKQILAGCYLCMVHTCKNCRVYRACSVELRSIPLVHCRRVKCPHNTEWGEGVRNCGRWTLFGVENALRNTGGGD